MECQGNCTPTCPHYEDCVADWDDGPDTLTDEEYDNGPEGHVHRPMDDEA